MKFSISFLLLMLAGCVNTSSNTVKYKNTNSEIGVPDDKKAVLVLYRKVVPPVIFPVSSTINGKSFTKLRNNTFSWSYLTPGEYQLEISWPFLALTPGETKKLNIEAGKYYFVEFGGNTNLAGVGAVAYNTHSVSIENHIDKLSVVKNCCSFSPSKF